MALPIMIKSVEGISFLVSREVHVGGSHPKSKISQIHFILPSLYTEAAIVSKDRIGRQPMCLGEVW